MGLFLRLGLIAIVIVVGGWELLREKPVAPFPATAPAVTRTLARVDLSIAGMDCIMCAAGLQAKLRALPGVSNAEVSYQDKRATVEFDQALTDRSRIVAAIQRDGLKVTR